MKGKKTLACMMGTIMGLSVFSFVGCKDENEKTQNTTQDVASVYTMLPTEKYMRTAAIEREESTELSLSGIKNETQSAQITFTAKTDVTSFDLEVSPLTLNSGDSVIPAENISVFAERYIDIYKPYWQSGSEYFAEKGYYPDALIPLDRYQKRREDSVQEGHNQALWIDVEIPFDAKAGDYNGTFKLVVNNAEQEIDVNLKVYDLVMPDEVHNPSSFAIWYERLAYGEKDNVDSNTAQTYFEYLWSKRLNSTSMPPKHNSSMEAWLAYAEELAVNPKSTAYQVPYKFFVWPDNNKLSPIIDGIVSEGETEAEKNRVEKGLVDVLETMLIRNLELREESGKETIDLFKKALFKYEDEPSPGQRINCVRIFCELLNKAKETVKEKYATQFAEHLDLLNSFNNVHELVTTVHVNDMLFVSNNDDGTPNYDKADGVQLWCPEMYKFNSSAFRVTVAERQSYGEKFWWYLCCSNTPRPSYYVESLPVNIRMQQWMQYDYSIFGIWYWSIAYYGNDIDNYNELKYFDSFCGGEGALVYPGVRYGMKEPISSWRLEQIRLGQQDYELFWLLNNYLMASQSEVSAQEVISAMGKDLYYGTTIKDGLEESVFEAKRLQILEILNAFAENDTQRAMSLINGVVKK